MKGENVVGSKSRLFQLFLSEDSPGPTVYEVSITDDDDVICSCPVWAKRDSCKHTEIVIKRAKDNGGKKVCFLSGSPTADEYEESFTSDTAHRNFVLKYGKIEVV